MSAAASVTGGAGASHAEAVAPTSDITGELYNFAMKLVPQSSSPPSSTDVALASVDSCFFNLTSGDTVTPAKMLCRQIARFIPLINLDQDTPVAVENLDSIPISVRYPMPGGELRAVTMQGVPSLMISDLARLAKDDPTRSGYLVAAFARFIVDVSTAPSATFDAEKGIAGPGQRELHKIIKAQVDDALLPLYHKEVFGTEPPGSASPDLQRAMCATRLVPLSAPSCTDVHKAAHAAAVGKATMAAMALQILPAPAPAPAPVPAPAPTPIQAPSPALATGPAGPLPASPAPQTSSPTGHSFLYNGPPTSGFVRRMLADTRSPASPASTDDETALSHSHLSPSMRVERDALMRVILQFKRALSNKTLASIMSTHTRASRLPPVPTPSDAPSNFTPTLTPALREAIARLRQSVPPPGSYDLVDRGDSITCAVLEAAPDVNPTDRRRCPLPPRPRGS